MPVRQLIKDKRVFGKWSLSGVESGTIRMALTWREFQSAESDTWDNAQTAAKPKFTFKRHISNIAKQIKVIDAVKSTVNTVSTVTNTVAGPTMRVASAVTSTSAITAGVMTPVRGVAALARITSRRFSSMFQTRASIAQTAAPHDSAASSTSSEAEKEE